MSSDTLTPEEHSMIEQLAERLFDDRGPYGNGTIFEFYDDRVTSVERNAFRMEAAKLLRLRCDPGTIDNLLDNSRWNGLASKDEVDIPVPHDWEGMRYLKATSWDAYDLVPGNRSFHVASLDKESFTLLRYVFGSSDNTNPIYLGSRLTVSAYLDDVTVEPTSDWLGCTGDVTPVVPLPPITGPGRYHRVYEITGGLLNFQIGFGADGVRGMGDITVSRPMMSFGETLLPYQPTEERPDP